MGPASTPVDELIIRDSEVGARDPAGGNDTIQLGRGYEEECNIGDVCKYVNIFIQAGPRAIADAGTGWCEWAFCTHKSSDPAPANTNLGLQTLGNVCTTYLRNECVMTGNFPIGKAQANSQNIKIKIPKSKQALKVGDEYVLYMHCRTVIATETSSTSFRVIASYIYRNYH